MVNYTYYEWMMNTQNAFGGSSHFTYPLLLLTSWELSSESETSSKTTNGVEPLLPPPVKNICIMPQKLLFPQLVSGNESFWLCLEAFLGHGQHKVQQNMWFSNLVPRLQLLFYVLFSRFGIIKWKYKSWNNGMHG